MAEGTKKKENNARSVYADIIDLPHPVSAKHPQMSLHDRAAQFASYKALSGYEDMIGEEARLTDRRIEPEEADLDILNRKLTLIGDRIAEGESPVVTFTVFVPDEKKAGTLTPHSRKSSSARNASMPSASASRSGTSSTSAGSLSAPRTLTDHGQIFGKRRT